MNSIQKELEFTRAKTRILEKQLELKCEIKECPMFVQTSKGWKAPEERYPMAVSFQCFGGFEALVDIGVADFVVYGQDIGSIREFALFYASTKYGANRLTKERIEDQSQIGRFIGLKKIVGQGYCCLEPEQQAIVDAGGTVEYEDHKICIEEYSSEIVGIYPVSSFFVDRNEDETVYICDDGSYLTLSEAKQKPDFDFLNQDYSFSI